MAALDWSLCSAVESDPGKVSGAWVFKGTRTPVAVVFENLEDGLPNTFPGTDVFSAFATVTLETFGQRTVQLGRINRHNRARTNADFVWTLVDYAHPSQFGPANVPTR